VNSQESNQDFEVFVYESGQHTVFTTVHIQHVIVELDGLQQQQQQSYTTLQQSLSAV